MICRILLFYVLSILLIGLNGALNHRRFICRIDSFQNSSMGLSEFVEQERNNLTIHYYLRESGIQYVPINFTGKTDTHPFVAVAASFMNTVVMTSVLSAGNHALFAGTRVLYGKFPQLSRLIRVLNCIIQASPPLYLLRHLRYSLARHLAESLYLPFS